MQSSNRSCGSETQLPDRRQPARNFTWWNRCSAGGRRSRRCGDDPSILEYTPPSRPRWKSDPRHRREETRVYSSILGRRAHVGKTTLVTDARRISTAPHIGKALGRAIASWQSLELQLPLLYALIIDARQAQSAWSSFRAILSLGTRLQMIEAAAENALDPGEHEAIARSVERQ